jgi:hypothetical protein
MARVAGWRRPKPAAAAAFELLEHVGLLVSLTGGVFVVIAVLGLAKFDTTTALGIVDTVGPVGVLVRGTLITGLPLIVPLLLQAAMVFARPRWWFAHHPRAFGAFAGVGLVLYLGVPWVIAALASTMVVAGVVGVLKDRNNTSPTPSGWGAQAGFAAVAGLVATLATAIIPWLPTQTITHPEAGTFTGFVLKVSDGYTTVLADRPRRIVRLDSTRTVFELCAHPSEARTSILQSLPAFETSVHYPKCPSSSPHFPGTPPTPTP